MRFSSYTICGTPRSGSTLLCDMLASTGVAGRPHSYYRQQDMSYWAQLWGVPKPHQEGSAEFEKAYLSAMLHAGTGDTGIFGLRVMWSSIADASHRLDAIAGDAADVVARFDNAFGPTLYIYLSRQDKIAQAISLIRAEQSGLWHRGADGTERERTAPHRVPIYDADRISDVLNELESDDIAWTNFFATRGMQPLRITYETLTADPQRALAKILLALDRDPEAGGKMRIQTSKLADADSLEWENRYRQEIGSGN